VVGAISEPSTLSLSHEGCDVIELRLDSLGIGEETLSYAKESTIPLLVTARGPLEGGMNKLSVSDRIEAYQELLPYAAAIDIELSSFPELMSIVEQAKREHVTVVGSFHDFEMTPPLDALKARIGAVADLHKFATMVRKESDLDVHRILLCKNPPLSVMGMGPLGADARPEMMTLGSILNYGYLGNTPTAPNQWPVSKLREFLND
jgi:3-dehydroquinate dehydratase-1